MQFAFRIGKFDHESSYQKVLYDMLTWVTRNAAMVFSLPT